MAAELSYKNGLAELLFVGETPWHREGFKFDRPPTWAELMAVVDYDLDKRPYFYPAADGSGRMVESTDAFYVARVDTGAVLGTVGSQYEPIPNRDAFEVLRPLIDEGVMTVETAGVLHDGADAWLLGKWDLDRFGPDVQEVFRASGDEVQPFATVMANHSGRRSVLIGQTPIRIVCANTLGQAETDSERNSARWATVRHTGGAKAKLAEEAERLFSGVVERYEVIARHYKAMKATYLTDEQFSDMVLDLMVPDPRKLPAWNAEAKLAEAVLARFERKRAALRSLWRAGRGHTGEPTAWFAYNAVVEALDHNAELWPTRGGCYRTAQLLTGSYAAMKNAVLDLLAEYSLTA